MYPQSHNPLGASRHNCAAVQTLIPGATTLPAARHGPSPSRIAANHRERPAGFYFPRDLGFGDFSVKVESKSFAAGGGSSPAKISSPDTFFP